MKAENFYSTPLKEFKFKDTWLLKIIVAIVHLLTRLFFRWEVEGAENLKQVSDEQGILFISNHVSLLDPVVYYLGLRKYDRPPRLVYKSEFDKNSILKYAFARVGAFPIKRDSADRAALRYATQALKRGENIGIYPEGTRIRKKSQKVELHNGFVLIAQMGKAPIVPTAIINAEKIKPEGTILPRFPKVKLKIGDPIYLSDFDSVPRAEKIETIGTYAMEKVYELRDRG